MAADKKKKKNICRLRKDAKNTMRLVQQSTWTSTIWRSEQTSVQHSFLDNGADEVLFEPVCQLFQILDLDPQELVLLLKLGCPLLHLELLLLASHPRPPGCNVVLDPHVSVSRRLLKFLQLGRAAPTRMRRARLTDWTKRSLYGHCCGGGSR